MKMTRSIDVKLLRKKYSEETGNDSPAFTEVNVYRKKGEWFIEDGNWINNQLALNGTLFIPDEYYIEWLEE
jgi:hypothetical protein